MGNNKYRIFEITSQEPYLTESKIDNGIDYKSIKRAAWIPHDRDKYTQKQVDKIKKRLDENWDIAFDEEHERYEHFESIREKYKPNERERYMQENTPVVGSVKPLHWHCYIEVNPAQEIRTIAKWFDTACQNVEVKKGRGAFVDCLEYAVHHSDKCKDEGKAWYDWQELKTKGFTVDMAEQWVNDKNLIRVKYGKDLNAKEFLRAKVLKEGLSLRDCVEQYPIDYADDRSTLIACRGEFLAHYGSVPETRYNFFITGSGGVGKDTVGRGLARQFYPDKEDEEIFHIVKDIDVPFEGYDGQPVIIWEDVRSMSLIKKFGRDGVFRLFDINPSRGRYNIKYGSMPLTNTMNILTSVETYTGFLNNLAGEYTDKYGEKHEAEDKNQAYRRFPFIIPITMDYMDILVQQAYRNGDYSFQEYEQYNRTRGNLAKMMWDKRIQQLSPEDKAIIQRKIEQKFLGSPVAELNKLIEDNRGLVDKAMTNLNDLMEEMFAEIDKAPEKVSKSFFGQCEHHRSYDKSDPRCGKCEFKSDCMAASGLIMADPNIIKKLTNMKYNDRRLCIAQMPENEREVYSALF